MERREREPEDIASDTVIPVSQEIPVVTKRTVETGRLRVNKNVAVREVVLDEALLRHGASIERIPIGRDVPAGEQLPRIRYEGETLIIPILEEVPVVVKKVVLNEEIRITRVSQTFHNPQTVSVRVEEVSVERAHDTPVGTLADDEPGASV